MALVGEIDPHPRLAPPAPESGGGVECVGDKEEEPHDEDKDAVVRNNHRSLSGCYFPSKRMATSEGVVVVGSRRVSASAPSDIQHHLQSMFYLLRPEETLKMAVKLESAHPGRTRYLVVVSRAVAAPENEPASEESCLLGIDCNQDTTVGLVLRVLADTAITLDGDGGFSVSTCGKQHIFKPVSVQAMWSALQTLHKVSSKAREHNYFLGGLTHEWATYYEQRVDSERSCLNEWHAMDSLESRRPPSPNSLRSKPCERAETETVIRSALKEIMMSVDLDEVTCKYIRSRLEEALDMDLGEYKPFIDQEMLTILGQMDSATEVFDHVFLGSEWNASNLEELQKNGVGHILNITREIDNFFPGTFNYLNVRVYDDEKTDLLRHWDNTFRYINRAKQDGSKVLVHCKMGVSRSASVVIAYAMKAYNWNLQQAIDFVKDKRGCIKPNTAFLSQLETYQGILDAVKNKERLLRSKSETNLKSPGSRSEDTVDSALNESVQVTQSPNGSFLAVEVTWSQNGSQITAPGRPKSWSPENNCDIFTSALNAPTSMSLEHLLCDGGTTSGGESEESEEGKCGEAVVETEKTCECAQKDKGGGEGRNYNLYVRMPCSNGQAFSVSQNKVLFLPPCKRGAECGASVKQRVTQLEQGLSAHQEEKGDEELTTSAPLTKLPPPQLHAKLLKKEIWDPAEHRIPPATSTEPPTPTPTPKPKPDDPFSAQLDRVFDREEKRQQRLSCSAPCETAPPPVSEKIVRECPSRQSSWSSYDSAVVLRESPSRQSSWGSADARPTCGTLPSRNSSWGSYDLRPSDELEALLSGFSYDREGVPWHPGTVKRTKQKLEADPGTKRACPDAVPVQPKCPAAQLVKADDGGVVRSLKKEFEAKSAALVPPAVVPAETPSSRTEEDLSVRLLVDRFEVKPKRRSSPASLCPQPPQRKSSFEATAGGNVFVRLIQRGPSETPKCKKQQGKTHPLARLAPFAKARHPNPVFNTM